MNFGRKKKREEQKKHNRKYYEKPGRIRAPLSDLLQNTDPRKSTIMLDHDPQGIRKFSRFRVKTILSAIRKIR